MPVAPDLCGAALDGRYELHAVIGEGAFGRVYRGRDRRLDRPVAVKVIKPWWSEDPEWVGSFEREAQLLARVSDPGIVQIFDVGHAEEGLYYVSELVDGESLQARLKRGRMEPWEAAALAEQLCRALAHAHSQRIIHRDVKPANILINASGRVKVGDFGVARLAEGSTDGQLATVVGTPRYMAPEQGRGLATLPATDVYSVGVVLHEMLAGEAPFTAGSVVELALAHLQQAPPALPAATPPELSAIVARALAKNPKDRYANAGQMARALATARRARRDAEGAPAPARSRRVRGAGGAGGGAGSARSGARNGAPAERRPPDGRSRESRPRENRAGDHPPRDVAGRGRPINGRRNGNGTGRPPAAMTGATRLLPSAAPPSAAPPAETDRTLLGEPMSRPRRWNPAARRRTVASFAAVLLLLAGLVTASVLAGRGHTTVPGLKNATRQLVRSRAARHHLKVAFRPRYSATVAAGRVISQQPAAGDRVSEHSTITVAISRGPAPVTVPNLTGESTTDAQLALERDGLHAAVDPGPDPGHKTGTVYDQSPKPQHDAAKGSTVTLQTVETPRWQPTLTGFSGTSDQKSVIFQIRGSQWRITYSMDYTDTCSFLFIDFCSAPEVRVVNSGGQEVESFSMHPGANNTVVVHAGAGDYQIEVAPGDDSVHYSVKVQDWY